MQYRVLETIIKDGQTINPGELVDLSEADAAQLLKLNTIEFVHRRFDKKIVVPGTPD